MTAYDWLTLVAVVICLLLSFFFAGSETALTAASRASMHRMEKQGNARAALVNRLVDARERMIGALAEVLPKTAAFNAPDRVALAVARPIDWTVRVLTPVLIAVEWVVKHILRLFGMKVGESESILSPHEELRGTVDLLHHEGGVERLDRDMLGGLLDLRDLTVADVMIHRTEVIMVDAGKPPEEAVEEVLAAPVTRVPLWRDTPENIIGVLHAK